MIKAFADWLIYSLFGLARGTAIAESANFFVYDSIKLIFLLIVMVFSVGYLRSFFPPEAARKALGRFGEFWGSVLAALLGVITPFCSCSSVPLFIGFVRAGLPLPVVFSFLISSPLVDDVSMLMLFALFGPRIATLYIIAGVVIAVACGMLIGRLKMDDQIEGFVRNIEVGELAVAGAALTWRDRVRYATAEVRTIVSRVWLYVIIGIGIGALIHGYAPADLLTRYAGPRNPLAIPVAVAIGVPLYANDIGIMPIAQALLAKGVALGTVLAFMMSTVALSLPEIILLRQVIKPKLLAVFVGLTAAAITVVGFLFNIIA